MIRIVGIVVIITIAVIAIVGVGGSIVGTVVVIVGILSFGVVKGVIGVAVGSGSSASSHWSYARLRAGGHTCGCGCRHGIVKVGSSNTLLSVVSDVVGSGRKWSEVGRKSVGCLSGVVGLSADVRWVSVGLSIDITRGYLGSQVIVGSGRERSGRKLCESVGSRVGLWVGVVVGMMVVGSDVGVERSVGRTWLQLMCCAPSHPSPRFTRADTDVGVGYEV